MTARRTALLTDAALALGITAVTTFLVAWLIVHAYHEWGDDYGMFIFQARAIGDGTLEEALRINTRMLELSDVPVGPPAYPWGYPAALWLAAQCVGWQMNDLKIIGILANGALAGAMFVLARHHLSRGAAIAVAAFVALQPPVLAFANHIASDVLGLAVCLLGLVAADRFSSNADRPERVRIGLVVASALLTAVAFSIRSQGALVAVSMFAVLARTFVRHPERRRALAAELAVLVPLTALLIFGYLRALPDGSLAHLSYLTLDPDVLKLRVYQIVETGIEFVPFAILRRLQLLNIATAVAGSAVIVWLVLIGASRLRGRAIGVVVFAVLNALLVLMFPSNGGPRYDFPVLPAIAILGAAGLAAVAQRAWAQRPGALPSLGRWSQGLCVAGMVAVVAATSYGAKGRVVNGPFTPDADSLFTFVRTSTPEAATMAFFKPRALRLFTGRMGIAVMQTEHLERADYVILDKHDADRIWEEIWQVPRSDVEAFGPGKYARVFETEQFVVYGPR